MSSEKNIVLGPCGKTEQECRDLYEKSASCEHFAALDSGSDDPFHPDNCVYYSQYFGQMIEEEMCQHSPEED